MGAVWLFLLVPLVLSSPLGCHRCDENCGSRYSNATLAGACVFGCHSSVGLIAQTDEFGVNIDCEHSCGRFEDESSKSACFVGCTFIPSLEIERPQNSPMSMFDAISGPILSRIISFFPPLDNGQPEQDQPLVGETHVRIVIPKEPSRMMDDDMLVMMNVVHDSDDQPSDSFQVVPLPSNDDASEVSSFARTFCRRARVAFHNLASHPIFLVSIILMIASSVTLLAFACVRLSARRARWATFQRQYRRMPALFKPASVRVSLLTPQPTSEDDEAPELPPKYPIDQRAPAPFA